MRLQREQLLSCRHNENWACVLCPGVEDRDEDTHTHTLSLSNVFSFLICPTSHLCLTFRANCIRAESVMRFVNDLEALPLLLPRSIPPPPLHVFQQTPPLLLTGCLIYDSNSRVQTHRRRSHSQLYVCILVPLSSPPCILATLLSLLLSFSLIPSLSPCLSPSQTRSQTCSLTVVIDYPCRTVLCIFDPFEI